MEEAAVLPPSQLPRGSLRSRLMPRSDGRRIRPETLAFTLVLGLLGALPPLSIDISAPTLLVVQGQMQTSASLVGMVITLFMVGFAIGQFAGGPVSDHHGRRPVLLIGLFAYTSAAIGCSLAGSITTLIGWRLVQGVGAGACAVLTFAMIRDLFEGDQARAKRSYITVVFGLAPMLAPLLGAWILDQAGWRLVYLVLSVGGFLLLLAVMFGVAESRTPALGSSAGMLRRSYGAVLSNRRFVGMVTVNALSFAAIFAYIAGSPLVLMGSLSLTPTGYGQVFACTAAMLTLGAWCSGQCAQRGVPGPALLWTGLGAGALSAAGLLLLMRLHCESLPVLLVPLMLHLFARGLTAPNLQHLALEPMREQAGTASATMGVIQILCGALSSAIVALLLPLLGPGAMALIMAVAGGAALLLWAALWWSLDAGPAGSS